MSFLNSLMSSEPEDIKELRKKIKDFEKGFEARNDYDDLQNLCACYFKISMLHPDPAKQNAAFMSGRNALEKAVAEANIELIHPRLIEETLEIYEKKSKQVFLRPLYDLFTKGFQHFLKRMQSATAKQLSREKMYLKENTAIYQKIAQKAGNLDSQWFDENLKKLEKEKSDSAYKSLAPKIHRTYGRPPAKP